ncbi:hypothetical protein LZ554_001324 [Drepanopeziza brunnea f. sp. 'monogermtubi']|nr:hypothetical protein LZ554_001324 [Drepanopeziza brunnea f. sp. 'monogermtubi']
MGPIVADNDGFGIGKNGLRADSSGFRLGNMLVADSNGFRLGGRRGFNADETESSLGGRSWGRRELRDVERCNHGSQGHGGHSRSHDERPHGRG